MKKTTFSSLVSSRTDPDDDVVDVTPLSALDVVETNKFIVVVASIKLSSNSRLMRERPVLDALFTAVAWLLFWLLLVLIFKCHEYMA